MNRILLFAICQLGLLLFCIWAVPIAQAAELPDHGPAVMQQILSQPEFHGREGEESIWQKLAALMGDKVRAWLKDIAKMFEGVSPADFSNTFLGRVFKALVKALEFVGSLLGVLLYGFWYLFWLSLLVALLYLANRYQIWRYLNLRRAESEAGTLSAAPVAMRTKQPLGSLLSSGCYLDALASLRRDSREKFAQTYGFLDSLTDREMMRLLPGSESKKAAFSEMAMLFEQLVFARRPLEEKTIASIRRIAAASVNSEVLF